jgi:hypothetical protein
VCESSAAIVAEAQLSPAPRALRPASSLIWGRPLPRPPRSSVTWPSAYSAGSRRCWPARPPTCPPQLRAAVAEQAAGRATVTILQTPLARAWRAHPAGRGR